MDEEVSMNQARTLALSILVIATALQSARADDALDTPAVRTLDSVAVNGIRHPQEFEYSDGARLLERFDRLEPARRDGIRLAFYARPTHVGVDLGGLELEVVAGDVSWPVELLNGGRVVLPSIPTQEVKNAKVIANVPEHALSIIYKVDLVPPAEGALTLGDLRERAARAREGWKAVYGKVAAITVPVFTCAEFEFTAPRAITVMLSDHSRWSSKSAFKVQVPLDLPGATSGAEIDFDRDSLVRIGGCKWKGRE